jgi:8-oxo-dGTP diphosphatase
MIKRSVALAITEPARPGSLLIVQRPDDDADLPGVWGLPAASLRDRESWHDAARRAGLEKLGVELAIGPAVAEGRAERSDYTLHMRVFDAQVAHGSPHVPQTAANVTQYAAWRWGSGADLRPAAERGSLCSTLYLSASGT